MPTACTCARAATHHAHPHTHACAQVGSPEKPLSDLGLLSYRSYWAWQLLKVLRAHPDDGISVMALSAATSIKHEDVLSALHHLGMVRTLHGQHVLAAPPDVVEKEFQRLDAKPGPTVRPERIHWAPYRDAALKRDKWSIASKLAGSAA